MEKKNNTIALIGGHKEFQKHIQQFLDMRYDKFLLFKNFKDYQQKNIDYRINLIILHLQVPQKSDIEYLKKIQDEDKNIRIIIISNKPSKHYEEIFWDKNSIYFVVLPEDQNFLKEVDHNSLVSRLKEKTNFLIQSYYPIEQGIEV